MAQEIIAFFEKSFEIPYIALPMLVIILVSDLIYDYKICKMSDSYMKEEIKELKKENNQLMDVIKKYDTNTN